VSSSFLDDHLLCVLSGHPDYPITTTRSGDTFTAFEGMVYNMPASELGLRLSSIASCLFDADAATREVTRLVDEADGEFLALIYDARHKLLIVFNDRWGRLPAYVYSNHQHLVVSRELKFVIPWLPRVQFDALGVAGFLLSEFVPGDGTLLKDVQALAPASLLRASIAADRVSLDTKRLAAECLDDPTTPLSREECCVRIRDLLLEATADRVKKLETSGYSITADLSGGFDSRLVCAALARTGVPVDLYTDALVTGDESIYAQKVATILSQPLTRVRSDHILLSSLLADVTAATDCTVNARTSLADRQDSIARLQLCGIRTARFLGLGAGEFIKRVPMVKRGYASVGQQMLAGHQVGMGSLRTVASLIQEPTCTLVHHIDTVLDAFPERTRVGHLKRWHFEYERKLVTYGEDRSRAFFWNVAPLWSRHLYEFALTRIPQHYGQGPSGIYFPLLESMDSSLADAPVFSTRVVHRSGAAQARQRVAEALIDVIRYTGLHVPGVAKSVELTRRSYSRRIADDEQLRVKMLTDLLGKPNLLWDVLDTRKMTELLPRLTFGHSWRLLTLALYGNHLRQKTGNDPRQGLH
jgi:hypothetical protein